MPAQLATIPLNLIEPHPKLAFRFDYDVEGLAESIKASADENTPNGQLNPGRVVLRADGEGYYVYVGVRRYYALKLLYQTTKDERFGFYTAYIDTGMTELQMFVRAKRENDEERGERKGLSVLEEIFGIIKIRKAIPPEGLDKWLRRLVDVADRLTEEKMRKLYEIEVATRFKFRLVHLEYLCGIPDEKEFFLTAATAANFSYTSDDMTKAHEDRDLAYLLRWFKSVFPGYEPDESAAHTGQKTRAGTKGRKKESKNGVRLEAHEEEVIIARCPRCKGVHKVQMRGEITVTTLPPEPEAERTTVVAESVSRVDCSCSGCRGRFYLFVKRVSGKVYAVESSASKKFREPRETVEAVELRFDFDKREWQKIVGESIVGVVPSGNSAKKR